ncbi:MAG: hypothetical protein JNJ82_06290 [Opitutaceae bacterium]|nr:hypothetical protein [Opitutaceae bacterium]
MAILFGLLAWLVGGCSFLPRATPKPIPTVGSLGAGAPAASTLVVFLPGRGDRMEDFERQGLSAELARAGVRADWISVDAHLGYYRERTVIDRLREDVIAPARARGYRRIVIVGLSLGGLGGLLYERDQPGQIDALVLIAPYLGQSRKHFAEITAAGGPAAWAASHTDATGSVETELWTFLGRSHGSLPPTWLAYGESDRLAEGHRLLGPLLARERVLSQPGGHDWKTWQALWRRLCHHSSLFTDEKRAP